MKTTLNFYEFRNWFEKHRPNNFSRAGLLALWEYLEELEEGIGEEIEFDPIALCVEYTEYSYIDEFHSNYDKNIRRTRRRYPTLDDLRDYTEVIEVGTESFIIQNF